MYWLAQGWSKCTAGSKEDFSGMFCNGTCWVKYLFCVFEDAILGLLTAMQKLLEWKGHYERTRQKWNKRESSKIKKENLCKKQLGTWMQQIPVTPNDNACVMPVSANCIPFLSITWTNQSWHSVILIPSPGWQTLFLNCLPSEKFPEFIYSERSGFFFPELLDKN